MTRGTTVQAHPPRDGQNPGRRYSRDGSLAEGALMTFAVLAVLLVARNLASGAWSCQAPCLEAAQERALPGLPS